MRVTFTGGFQNGTAAINRAGEELFIAQQQVQTGRRLNLPSDDPIGASLAVADHAQLARIDSYTQSTDAAESRLTVADSVLTDIVNQITAAQTVATGARGTTQTAAARSAAASQLLAIRDSLMNDINTKFRGTYLFGGTTATVVPYQTITGTTAYHGNTTTMSVDVGTGRSVQASFDGSALFQGSDPAHLLDTLTTLAADVIAGNNTNIGTGIDALDRAFSRATSTQTGIGQSLNALDVGRVLLATQQQDATTRAAKIENVDMAAAIARMSHADTAYRAALGAFATTGRLTLMDYLR